MITFDIIFIGGGPAGYTGAIRAAQLGKSVGLIEKGPIGGTCLNKGCIPTKSLISSLHVHDMACRGKEFGIEIISSKPVYSEIISRKEKIIQSSRRGVETLLKKWKVSLINGYARFADSKTILVQSEDGKQSILKAENIIITSGSRPISIPGIKTDGITIFNSDTILDIEELPKKMIIIGGGAIGCEYAYIFNRLGVDVSIVEMEHHLLPLEDEEIAKTIEREFKKKKINVLTGRYVQGVEKISCSLVAKLSDGKEIIADKILVSVGRRANSEDLGLEEAGIPVDEKKRIIVNNRLETGVKGIYAAGDVTGKYQLAYVAEHEAFTAVENICGHESEMRYDAVPKIIFSEPEVGSVGLNEKEARALGSEIVIGTFPFRTLGRAQASGEIAGMAKVICDKTADTVLGVHVAGAHASEIIHAGVLAISKKMTASEWSKTLFGHPVFSEAIMEALWDTKGYSIHKLS